MSARKADSAAKRGIMEPAGLLWSLRANLCNHKPASPAERGRITERGAKRDEPERYQSSRAGCFCANAPRKRFIRPRFSTGLSENYAS